MGCITSKEATVKPSSSEEFRDNGSAISGSSSLQIQTKLPEPGYTKVINSRNNIGGGNNKLGESKREKPKVEDRSFRLRNLHRHVEGEQVAAGWPSWLSAVAGEAIHGWIPLRAESFEKLEKIGQGTYSSVFRARELATGRMLALKKVRFDNFEPESVRFMSREIMILRKLDHPNVMKLEGLITSRLSTSVYLVFEYMEHDIAGLSSCPDIQFSESQVKCYMHQLLSGLEHCHSRGIMHRDIKGSNLLVSDDGVLKIADFGLANFVSVGHIQPLTSRVVTLWYRPPELLLGSTSYGQSVDLWSVGCLFAELLLGKPILKGRTEVEQLHKIFKLCGSPPDEYWKKFKLPHATIFKPQNSNASCLSVTCKDLPTTALNLMQTLLSIEPYKRGTASAALKSKYFTTRPYACHASSLPKYPPNKEIDARTRDEARRKRAAGRARKSETTRRRARVSNVLPEPKHAVPPKELHVNIQNVHVNIQNVRKSNACLLEEQKKSCQEEIYLSGPLHITPSSGFAWVRSRNEDLAYNGSEMQKHWTKFERLDSFDDSKQHHSQGFSTAVYQSQDFPNIKRSNKVEDRVDFSGPLTNQHHKAKEPSERRSIQERQAAQRTT
ncbi:hypothetical protein MKW98_017633 [Papaver atlanticum]|uniref:Protein kinase domain-containing protein n=1 Tax=Papaver atlanticum TaxID=357466 RepID=A0AAD4TBV8_9MAGN|nr:hypothetical protein MKW98_017633 [Papaver atlanticum]